MKGGRSLPMLAVLAFALAGCADAPLPGQVSDAVGEAVGTDVATDASGEAATMAPRWVHGDWWRYKIVFDPGIGEPLFDASDQIVVASLGSGYTLASGGRDLAVIDAEFDSFFVGPVDKDLTGQQGFNSVPFKMFAWPLVDGASWRSDFELTDVNGETSLTSLDLAAEAGPDGTFLIQGSTPEGAAVAYTYDPAVKWIRDFTWTSDSGRTVMAMQLEESGAGYEGTFTQVAMEVAYEKAAIVPFFVFDPSIAPTPDTFTLGEADFVLRVVALFTFASAVPPAPAVPGVGAGVVAIVAPDGAGSVFQHESAEDSFTVDVATLEDQPPGTYEVAYALAGTGIGAYVLVHAFQETITEFTAASHTEHGA